MLFTVGSRTRRYRYYGTPPKNKIQGWGPFSYEWYSFCSAHQLYSKDCKTCQSGNWHNVWKLHLSSLIYKISPKFWMWLFNL